MKLELSSVACRRGGHAVFDGVSATLDAGDLLVLHGPNGSGKSSLLRLIAGPGCLVAGRILCDGSDIADDRGGFAARLAYMGHQDALKPGLSVSENLSFWAGLQRGKRPSAAIIYEALGVLGLAGLRDLPVRFLSAGQRRRAALVRALASGAELWLLDEPANALDSTSLAAFGDALKRHRANGGSAVIASHIPIAPADSSGVRTLHLGENGRTP